MKYKALLTILALSLFLSCKKDEDKPINVQNTTSIDFPKQTGTLILKVKILQDFDSENTSFRLERVYGKGDGIILLQSDISKNDTAYNLGEWNSGEYILHFWSPYYRGRTFQIQANSVSEIEFN